MKIISTIVVIHVYDERRRIHKNFECFKSLLLSEMKYFDSYFASESYNYQGKIDISVHCDCFIFEWIMNFIQHPQNPPALNNQLVAHILIASEFLGIERLITECISFISVRLKGIILAGTDLSPISDKTVSALAQNLQPESLLEIPQNLVNTQLMSRIYKAKIQLEFHCYSQEKQYKRKENLKESKRVAFVSCCKYCGKVFVSSSQTRSQCRFTPQRQVIGKRGEFLPTNFCEPSSDWSFTNFLTLLYKDKRVEYGEIYWRLWTTATVVRTACGKLISVNSDSYGRSCPKSATFCNSNNGLWGIRLCCGKLNLKYNPWNNEEVGCSPSMIHFDHAGHTHNMKLNDSVENQKTLRILSILKKTLLSGFGPLYNNLNAFDGIEQSQKNVTQVNDTTENMMNAKKPFSESINTDRQKVSRQVQHFGIFVNASYENFPHLRKSMDNTDFALKLGIWLDEDRYKQITHISSCESPNEEVNRTNIDIPICKFNRICGMSIKNHVSSYSKLSMSMKDKKRRDWLKAVIIEMDTKRLHKLNLHLSNCRDKYDIDVMDVKNELRLTNIKYKGVRPGLWRTKIPVKNYFYG